CALWAPFGHGKSAGLLVPLIAWLVGRDPQSRIKVVSAGDTNAAKRLGAAKQIMESPDYREVFPDVRRGHKWTDHEIFVRRAGSAIDPTLEARGVETNAVGQRADVILFDDVVNDMNSMEQQQRAKVKDRTHVKWLSRLDPVRGR